MSLSILALSVVRALNFFLVGGNSSGDVAFLVYCSVAKAFEYVFVAVVLEDAILEQLLLSFLFCVVRHATRIVQMIIAKSFHALLLLLVEELLLEVFAALLRQRLVMVNMYMAAVMDGFIALNVLFLKPGRLVSSFAVYKYLCFIISCVLKHAPLRLKFTSSGLVLNDDAAVLRALFLLILVHHLAILHIDLTVDLHPDSIILTLLGHV